MNLLYIILILILLVILYQDFKHKAIDWYLFLLLPLIIILLRFNEPGKLVLNFLINFIFLSFNSLMLFAYFSLKNRKFINPLKKYIGIGDIFFFTALALFFSPLNFILFFSGSMLITLLTFLFAFALRKENLKREIPLAGFVSGLLLVLLFFNYFISINLYNDHWIITHLTFNGIY